MSNVFSKSGRRKFIVRCQVGRQLFCLQAEWALKIFRTSQTHRDGQYAILHLAWFTEVENLQNDNQNDLGSTSTLKDLPCPPPIQPFRFLSRFTLISGMTKNLWICGEFHNLHTLILD